MTSTLCVTGVRINLGNRVDRLDVLGQATHSAAAGHVLDMELHKILLVVLSQA